MTISFGVGAYNLDEDFLFDQIDQRLGELSILHRGKVLAEALKSGVAIVGRRYEELLPRSIKKKVSGIHLADMPDEKVTEFETAVVALSGVEKTKRDARKLPPNIDWLLEHGHRIVVRGTAERIFTPGKFNRRFTLGRGYTFEPRRQHAASKSKRTGESGKGQVVGFVEPGHYLERAIQQEHHQCERMIIDVLDRAVAKVMA